MKFWYGCLSLYNFSYVYCSYSERHSEIAYMGFLKNKNNTNLVYLQYPKFYDKQYTITVVIDLVYKIFDYIDELLLAIYTSSRFY